MIPENKILAINDFDKLEGFVRHPPVILCYGHFNIIHPGHIRYLEHAKSLGKQLIVALQGDNDLKHSNNPQQFPAKDRAIGLAWLHIVDFVVILNEVSLEDVIKTIRPNLVVLGKEFEKKHKKY